jgi:transcriptional regulator with GAF, ATPase, and Fis domain
VATIEEAAAQIADSERHAFLAVPDRAAALAETRWVTALPQNGLSGSGSSDSLSRLLEVNQRLATELEPNRLLEYIIDSAILLTGAERGFLLMHVEGSPNPEVVVARNIDQENIRNKKLKVSYSIASQVITTGEAVLTTDAMGDDRYTEYLSIHHLKLRSVLCLPMSRGQQVRGALYVDNRFQSSAFSKNDLTFMEAFANQAAIALYNAHILQERAEALDELAASQTKVQELNERLQQQLDEKTKELEATERLLVVQRKQLSRHHGYDTIIGNSPPMSELFGMLDRVCANDISVLVTGESGTGKEVVAKAVHYNGNRSNRSFVALNCSSIPESLIESELFGHVRGAFTGATTDKKGMFEVAHRGTLFLDEIGEMPFEMQAKLLRALQEGEIQKVGGTRPIKVDVRIIAATNRNLREMVREKTFREDLYYRLAVVTIELPPLRKRSEDIPLLIEHFLRENTTSNLSPVNAISKAALRLLLQYQWPGNVRELQTVIKNASIFAETDILQPDDFSNFPQIMHRRTHESPLTTAPDAIVTLAELERAAIIRALEQNRGNKKRTAEMLGIDRRTLYNKLATYGISIERRAKVTGESGA